jgi:uncharacterized protein with PQ loop repeat
MTVSTVAGFIATVLGVAFIWPQVIRVYAKNSVEGVSATSQLIGLSGTLMWFSYGVATGSTPIIISNINIEIAVIALIVMLIRKGSLPLWKALIVFAATAVFCVAGALVSASIIGIAGVIIGTPAIFPQVWRALRTPRLYGVSVSSYSLLAAMGSGWFAYGLSIGDPVVSYPNLILIPCASYIAWRAWVSRRAGIPVNAA